MLQPSFIRDNFELVLNGLAKRGLDMSSDLHSVLNIDEERKSTQKQLDDLLAESNLLSKEIGDLYKSGKRDLAETKKARTHEIKAVEKNLVSKLSDIENQLEEQLRAIPNIPHHSVPAGKSADDNVEVRRSGEIPNLVDQAKPHWELAKDFDLIDFELGVKITGAGFPVYKGKGARLQRALINFFLDKNIEAGFQEVLPPHFVNEDSAFGTGQLPDKEGQMYVVPIDGLYAIPTAEVPVTNLYRNDLLDFQQLPIKNTAYTPCFRREAGSYGKDVRGLNRLHQFDKVEVVVIENPEKSYETLESMVNHVATLLDALELPYRVLKLCGGDMGFTSALTYDFEVWSAAQERWLEVSSVSNFETFQSNRLKLRYRPEDGGKPQLCHTLNGSSLALPRVVAALLENHQDSDGIRIPKALIPYTHFDRI
jgi:seryl-tRNA synthetase